MRDPIERILSAYKDKAFDEFRGGLGRRVFSFLEKTNRKWLIYTKNEKKWKTFEKNLKKKLNKIWKKFEQNLKKKF